MANTSETPAPKPAPVNGGHCGRHSSHFSWCDACVDAKNGVYHRYPPVFRTNSRGARMKGVWCGGATGDVEYEPAD